MISPIVLGIVFLLIALRRIGSLRFQIWQIMAFGALAVILTGQITPLNAIKAINIDVMLFLFGVFLIGKAMEDSGYLANLTCKLFGKARTLSGVILGILFGLGFLSMLLMNDTVAIVGTPMAVSLARRISIQPRVLLLALAFAVTTGSVASPIGNPQNLLIALSGGVDNPFISFLRYLLVPTLINMLAAYAAIRLFYRQEFRNCRFPHEDAEIIDKPLARMARLSLILLVLLVCLRIASVLLSWNIDFRLTYISLIAAVPVLLYVPRRPRVLAGMDWSTLVFFAAMFVLMQAVWDSGVIQTLLNKMNADLTTTPVVLAAGVLLSQVLSNVPLVALYLPLLNHLGAGTTAFIALAAGSTIAGNLTIIGAASNVIIIQNAEKRCGIGLGFWEFFRIGAPLTAVNTLIYWLFLK
jgi:Na+/H+ antiporter NhaD/arsenite permease-like protein